jgi:hypothetical protein
MEMKLDNFNFFWKWLGLEVLEIWIINFKTKLQVP